MQELLSGNHPYMQYTLDLQVTMAIVQGHKPQPKPSLESAERKLVWLICLECWALTPTNRPSMKEIVNGLTLDEDFIPQATNVDFELPSPSLQDYDGPGSDEEEEIELERSKMHFPQRHIVANITVFQKVLKSWNSCLMHLKPFEFRQWA